MVDIQSEAAERRGKKKEEERNQRAKIFLFHRAAIKTIAQ